MRRAIVAAAVAVALTAPSAHAQLTQALRIAPSACLTTVS